jgi:hypothetical protein
MERSEIFVPLDYDQLGTIHSLPFSALADEVPTGRVPTLALGFFGPQRSMMLDIIDCVVGTSRGLIAVDQVVLFGGPALGTNWFKVNGHLLFDLGDTGEFFYMIIDAYLETVWSTLDVTDLAIILFEYPVLVWYHCFG